MLHCCCTVVPLLLQSCYSREFTDICTVGGGKEGVVGGAAGNIVILLSHQCDTAVTLLLHCCYTVVTAGNISIYALLDKARDMQWEAQPIILLYCCHTNVTLLLHCCSIVVTLLSQQGIYRCTQG
jgi:hypothetical protein